MLTEKILAASRVFNVGLGIHPVLHQAPVGLPNQLEVVRGAVHRSPPRPLLRLQLVRSSLGEHGSSSNPLPLAPGGAPPDILATVSIAAAAPIPPSTSLLDTRK